MEGAGDPAAAAVASRFAIATVRIFYSSGNSSEPHNGCLSMANNQPTAKPLSLLACNNNHTQALVEIHTSFRGATHTV